MITRKENLFVKPFQQKKFIEHRNKVSSALPRIDDVSPPQRNHVYIKCKKIQIEMERHAKIERDNFILLKHLSDIMNAKRVDNYWIYEQPKVKLFRNPSSKPWDKNEEENVESVKFGSRKERCIGCHPENFKRIQIIPEERIPFEIKQIREHQSPNDDFPNIKFANKSSPKTEQLHKTSKNIYKLDENKEQEIPEKHMNHSFFKRGKSAKIRESFKNSEKMSFDAKPLTIIMRFPPKVHVTLNASIRDEVGKI